MHRVLQQASQTWRNLTQGAGVQPCLRESFLGSADPPPGSCLKLFLPDILAGDSQLEAYARLVARGVRIEVAFPRWLPDSVQQVFWQRLRRRLQHPLPAAPTAVVPAARALLSFDVLSGPGGAGPCYVEFHLPCFLADLAPDKALPGADLALGSSDPQLARYFADVFDDLRGEAGELEDRPRPVDSANVDLEVARPSFEALAAAVEDWADQQGATGQVCLGFRGGHEALQVSHSMYVLGAALRPTPLRIEEFAKKLRQGCAYRILMLDLGDGPQDSLIDSHLRRYVQEFDKGGLTDFHRQFRVRLLPRGLRVVSIDIADEAQVQVHLPYFHRGDAFGLALNLVPRSHGLQPVVEYYVRTFSALWYECGSREVDLFQLLGRHPDRKLRADGLLFLDPVEAQTRPLRNHHVPLASSPQEGGLP